MLKKLNIFFSLYNNAIKTNVYYFVCSPTLICLLPQLYTLKLVTCYYIKENKLFVYIPIFSTICKKFNFKFYRIYHKKNKLFLNGIYLSRNGLCLGVHLKKKFLGGRLLYLL